MNTSTKHEYLYHLDLKGQEVLDLGCGDASYWLDILKLYPSMKLHLFEPDQKVMAKAKQTLEGTNVVFSTDLKSFFGKKFDFITCFAVLEHVFNLDSFVENVALLLKDDGRAYINYDDGHFRRSMYQSRTSLFRFRNNLKTRLALLWKILRWYSKYQRPVNASKLEKIIKNHGLEVISQSYHSFDSVEVISGIIDSKSLEKIYPLVLKMEGILNASLPKEPEAKLKGHGQPFLIFSSRTVVLKHNH